MPLAKLDRARLLATAGALKPRGETPLIRSILKAVADLKAAGGGSVMLITDGEESCKGNAKLAALQRLPYDVFDTSGKLFAAGQTSELSRELPPGSYRIRSMRSGSSSRTHCRSFRTRRQRFHSWWRVTGSS